MGRNKRWESLNCLSIILIFLSYGSRINGDGELGCLVDKTVCKSLEETCYDDAAFGRCASPYSLADPESTYRHNLGSVELELLRSELEKLVAYKYQWSHPYTQCIIKTTLDNIRYKISAAASDKSICDDFEGLQSVFPLPLDYLQENSQEKIDVIDDPRISPPLAVVNFMPTRGHGYGDFANERYYPPPRTLDELAAPKLVQPADFTNYHLERLALVNHENPSKFMDNENESITNDFDETDNADAFAEEHEDERIYELSRDFQDDAEAIKAAEKTKMLRSRRQSHRDDAMSFIDTPYDDYSDLFSDNSREINRNVVLNNSMIDQVIQDNHDVLVKFFETMRPASSNDGYNDGEEDEEEEEEEEKGEDAEAETDGMVWADDEDETMSFRDFGDIPYWKIAKDFAGFKRPERLDVKKPGPYFSTNNYAFKAQTLLPPPLLLPLGENSDENDGDDNDARKNYVKKELVAGKDITLLSLSHDHRNVDLDHAFIKFNKDIHTWVEGEIIVKTVGKLLGLESNDLTDIRVGKAEVTFKVNPNRLKMNAKQLAKTLSKIREDLEKIINMNIVEGGIGDKVKIPIVEFPQLQTAQPDSPSVIGIIVFVVMGAIAAASIVLIIIVHRQAKTRRKLAGLATPDPEASKDYQELCRARMHAKVPSDKPPESPRVINLSRESESNRSSTSSWGGDDPAALSNMDISTGHMVLTYMEDHLKNKDLLDQEWAAICAYETDPSSIAIAIEKSNIDKNRQHSALPYDHSRIVLNELTNLNNSDYINASTITDHDPRNPAYIATQGPLPQTSSDFWQLVWEQGSVVIVMLTRLTEEGEAMCHRYWPEEGSELYHIYEVHLVSEHIWCDDYLVRSFYLKNMRTGETRTVTQFHFLSWPENGVPQSTKALLEFRRKVNKSYRGRSCPIVIHCSDGAGRTGTYCLIDMVLNRMAKGAKEIDLAAALEHIRDQRPGMVSTKQQFEFVLVAVAEEVHAILKALPIQQTEKTQNPSSSSSGSEK